MATIDFSVETDLSPADVLAVAADFTARRPELWTAISRKFYEVYETGPGHALVREGSDVMGGIWARERYEWNGTTITGTVQDSNIFARGTWTLSAEPKPGGGSVVHVAHRRRARGLKGHVVGAMVQLTGKKVLAKSLAETLTLASQAKKV